MRGKHVTKPMEEVLREARELAADGVRELIVVAQDTTYYGLDLYGRVRLAELLRELDRIDGLEWVRILYAYPIHFGDELIETMATAKKIIPYLDMPLQHISDYVLRRMSRKVDRAATEDLLGRLRRAMPDLTMRTTFIVGFPGETEAEFMELAEFLRVAVRAGRRLPVLAGAGDAGGPAARPGPGRGESGAAKSADGDPAGDRLRPRQAQIGKELEAIVDGPDAEVPGCFAARGHADAPDIDCTVRLKGKALRPGDLVRARVTGADGYDLLARAIKIRCAGWRRRWSRRLPTPAVPHPGGICRISSRSAASDWRCCCSCSSPSASRGRGRPVSSYSSRPRSPTGWTATWPAA